MSKPRKELEMSVTEYADYLTGMINQALNERFKRYMQGGWEENHITTDICWNLSEDSGQVVNLGAQNALVKWRAQRHKGRSERETGDIAIIIRYKYLDRQPVFASAHLEAKRIYFNIRAKTNRPIPGTGSFKSLNEKQIRTHLKNTSAHYMLLYDILDETLPTATNLVSRRFLTFDGKDGRLHKFGESLGDVLAHQFIKGYGLDYIKSDKDQIKKLLSDANVSYVLVGNVYEQGERGDSRNDFDDGQGPGPGGRSLERELKEIGLVPIEASKDEGFRALKAEREKGKQKAQTTTAIIGTREKFFCDEQ